MKKTEPKLTVMEDTDGSALAEALAAIDALADAWRGPVVPQKRVPEFTCGAISYGYFCNLVSEGHGPEGRFFIGKSAVYPKELIIEWLKARVRVGSFDGRQTLRRKGMERVGK